MKRAGRLIEKIADLENLQLAFYKAQKGKADKREVLEYVKRLQANLQNLQAQILSGEVETGHYNYFTIYDPKKRLICAAPFGQRVLHHAVMNVCHPFFANHYLSGADHFVKEVLQIKAYIRYMDDSVLWHNDRKILLNAGLSLKQYSAAELKLTLKPFCLNQNSHGLPFLGYLLYPDRTRLAQRSRLVCSQDDCATLKCCKRAAIVGSNRVLRGGSWNNDARNCRSANRNNTDPANRNDNIGFRLVFVP